MKNKSVVWMVYELWNDGNSDKNKMLPVAKIEDCLVLWSIHYKLLVSVFVQKRLIIWLWMISQVGKGAELALKMGNSIKMRVKHFGRS